MKNLISTLLLIFVGLSAHAQREIALDTIYVTTEAGKIFIYSYVEYTDGGRKGNFGNGDYRASAPDTTTVRNYLQNQSIERARQYAGLSVQALQKAQVVSAINSFNTALLNFAGIGILDTVQTLLEPGLIGEDWTFKTTPTAPTQTAVRVFKNPANGALRIDFTGGVVRTIIPFAETWFRVLNYPDANTNTDFYLMPSGAFVSVGANATRSFYLRKSSIAQAVQQAQQGQGQ